MAKDKFFDEFCKTINLHGKERVRFRRQMFTLFNKICGNKKIMVRDWRLLDKLSGNE